MTMSRQTMCAIFGATTLFCADIAQANDVGQTAVAAASHSAKAFPSIFGASSAMGPPGGTGYVSLSYVNPRGGVSGNGADGDLSFGYTIGNPVKNVGVTLNATLLSLDPVGEDGELSLSFSRLLVAKDQSATFLGASVGSLLGWGDAENNDTVYSIYGSHLVAFPTASGELPVQFTLGWGSDSTLSDDGLGTSDEGFFFGVGMGVSETISVSVSGTQTQLNAGVSVSLKQVPGVGLTAGVYDVSDNTDRQQVALGVAYSF